MNNRITYFIILIAILLNYCDSPEENKSKAERQSSPVAVTEKKSKHFGDNYPILKTKRETDVVVVRPDTSPDKSLEEIIRMHPPVTSQQPIESGELVLPDSRYITERDYNYGYETEIESKATNHLFSITFANDIFNNTDHYYTNGIRFDLIHPGIKKSPLSFLLIPNDHGNIVAYGATFMQNMYTPLNPDLEEIVSGDRPFSSYLMIGQYKISINPRTKIRTRSGINLGVIGSAAMGGFVQKAIHNIEPRGWIHQIKNDLLVSYYAEFEKALITSGNFTFDGIGGFEAGTLYDKLTLGVSARFGNYRMIEKGSKMQKELNFNRFRYSFFVRAITDMVGYDATLQGGVFNRRSTNTLDKSQISDFVFHASAGFSVSYAKFSLTLEQNYLSPEFRSARAHRWVSMKTSYSL